MPALPSRINHSLRNGFTLVELLVATGIFTLLTALLLSVTLQINNTWQQSDAQKSRRQNGRAALDLIARDLQAAIFPPSSSTAQTAKVFLVNPTGMETVSNRDALFWIAALPRNQSQNDLTLTGWFVRWTNNKAVLCRLSTTATAANYYDIQSAWLSSVLLNAEAPGTANDFKGAVADDVLALYAKLYDHSGNSIATPFDSTTGSSLPASVEIALVVADSRSATRITSAAAIVSLYGSATTPEIFIAGLAANVRSGVHIYRTRVNLENAR